MFTVRLQPGGQVFTVEEQENILAEGLRQGVALPYGCRGGSCGSCAATLLQGEVDYPSGEPMGLSPYDRDQGRVLLCQAVAYSDLELDSPHVGMLDDIEVKTLPARVEKLRRLNDDVMEVTLKLPTSEHLRFQAGQYVDILLRDGRRRSFSLANAPYDDQYLELHIRHVAGGDFTGQVFSTLKEKALWRIEGPLGQFYVRDSERPMVLMAGGTGFAPIKSILEQMRASGLGRPVYFYWGVRTQADLYLDSRVLDWALRESNLHYRRILSNEPTDSSWDGLRGWVHEAVLAEHADLSGFDVYMSGPPPP